MKRTRLITLMTLLAIALGPLTTPSAPAAAQSGSAANRPTILSAYYGLHAALPLAIELICHGGTNKDGMPIILSRTIDFGTLSAADFSVITKDGQRHTPICATVAPANDLGETRTVLLVGDLGDPQSNPPMRVEIVGSLLTNGPDPVQDFRGASIDNITPFGQGPTLVLAESLPPDQQRLGSTGRGAGCPVQKTIQVVRATWSGGVTAPSGADVGDTVRQAYKVTIQQANGSTTEVTPFALGDLNDNDNNHHLCLDMAGTPLKVSMATGMLVSPGKFLNPPTEVAVTPASTGRTGFDVVENGCVAYYQNYSADPGEAKS
jgi:hypothetical protein